MKRVHEDKRYNRKSFMAINVAKEVVQKIQNKEPINLMKIQVSNGYSPKSAHAQKALQTKSYKAVVRPVLSQIEAIRQKTLDALFKKDHELEKYHDLIDGMDKLTKNSRLLEGLSTENVASNIVAYGSEDFLALQENKRIGGAQ